MGEWLKDNIVGIVMLLATFAGAIWSLLWDVAAVAQGNPKAFIVWTFTSAFLGFIVAWAISGTMKHKAEQRRHENEHSKSEEEKTRRTQIEQDGETKRLEMNYAQERAKRERLAKEAQDKKDCLRNRVLHFPMEQKDALLKAVAEGILTLKPADYGQAASLEDDGLLKRLDTGKKFEASWKPTDLARDIVNDKDEDLWALLSEAEATMCEKRHRELLDSQQENFYALGFDQRRLAYAAWKSKDGVCLDMDTAYWSDFDSAFVSREELADGVFRYTIAPQFEDLFSERGEQCFKSVIEYLQNSASE